MRPIPAPRLGDSHGLMRAIDGRERLRLEDFMTEFSADDLFPPGLENALGRQTLLRAAPSRPCASGGAADDRLG